MGKSTIIGSFSIAMLVITRGYQNPPSSQRRIVQDATLGLDAAVDDATRVEEGPESMGPWGRCMDLGYQGQIDTMITV